MRFLILLILAVVSNLAFAGYDLHITGKKHWANEKGSSISLVEWHSYVRRDKEVRRDRQTQRTILSFR